MSEGPEENLDHLAAWIHGRRSRIADAERLDALCRLGGPEELSRTVLPQEEPLAPGDLQRRLEAGWLREVEALARCVAPRRAAFLEAMGRRLRVEDLKLRVRGLAAGQPPEAVAPRFPGSAGDPALAGSGGLEDLAARLAGTPFPELRKGPDDPALRPFLLETRLDHGYFRGLLDALERLDPGDRRALRPLVHQEADHFHLLLAARGRFLHRIPPEFLLPWHLEGTGIPRERFRRMLSAADLCRAAALAAGRALDPGPLPDRLDPAAVDALAWNRYLRLALRLFRQGGMDFGTLAGHLALRRVEVANLATLSEGLRLGMPFEALKARRIPRTLPEASHA